MDIEEARRRLAEHPPQGDPTTAAGETLDEKADRLRAEQGPCRHDDTWFDRTICPEPCGAMHTRCTNCSRALDRCWIELYGSSTRSEFGVRVEDGLVIERRNRDAAETTARSIRHRGGTATLVTRQVTVTDWTEAEVQQDGAA